jgi:TetR/AcrR family transcriptional regulator, mexJK operon transcriptional repressor
MTAMPQTQRAGRPKSEEKRQAILDAAAALFLDKGMQGASMDAVARQAGVSKQTVYSNFQNKETLYSACIRAKIASYGFEETGFTDAGEPGAALLNLVKRFMALIFDPDVVAMHRVVMAEAASHPQIAALFYASGPGAVQAAVDAFLQCLIKQGALRPHDTFYAAKQLLNMAFGHFHLQLQFGLIQQVPEPELDAHLQHVVADFLVLYGSRIAGDEK